MPADPTYTPDPADAETRWGVVLEDGTTLETLTEYGARLHAQELNLPLVHRRVGPWLPAPTTTDKITEDPS